MRKFISWCGLAVIFLAGDALYSQSAQEVIDIAHKNYAEMTGYSGVIAIRKSTFSVYPTQEGADPRFEVRNLGYTQIEAKWRRPGDWLLLKTQTFGGEINSQQRVQFSALSRLGNGPVLQNSYQSAQSKASSYPTERTEGVVRAFIQTTSDQLILKQFLESKDVTGNIAWGVVEPELLADEICQTEECYQIKGQTTSGQFIYLWISKSKFLLMRSLTVGGAMNARPTMPGQIPSPQTPSTSELTSRVSRRLVVDTLLMDQQINPSMSSTVFSLPPTGKFDRGIGERAGFADVASVVKFIPPAPTPGVAVNSEGSGGGAGTGAGTGNGAGSGTGFGVGGNSGSGFNTGPTPAPDSAAEAKPPAGTTAASSPSPVPVPSPAPAEPANTGQMLTPTQMSGIVLIDGDEGKGSGFMTKIKGVDFVVTNLHVVGGNKKFTLKTLRGVEVPVLGIFGAIGSDIAILRIGKGEGDLKLAEDVFTTAKIGDRVAVVGNRFGGGVATQTPGNIVGIGPLRVEVSANFESGNSGSPIVNLSTGEVIGIASYAETRRVDIDAATERRPRTSEEPKVEKRWFGFRVDAVTKWETIDLAKWKAQSEQIEKFRGLSEALVAFLKLDFRTARQHPRLTGIMDGFENRYRATGGNSITAATEVKDLFRIVRTISGEGMSELTTGDYYDYFRSCLYWENSITAQVEYRKAIIEALKKYEANSSSYVSRMRNGG